jgi:hypothetical protein
MEGDLSKILEFPDKNWLLFAIADKDQQGILYTFAEKCLDSGVLYVCGAGEACGEIENAFDLAEVDRKLVHLKRDLKQDDFDDPLMTTRHDDFDEGFWFSATVAHHALEPINKIVVANLTVNNYEFIIKDLVVRLNSGWLPSD